MRDGFQTRLESKKGIWKLWYTKLFKLPNNWLLIIKQNTRVSARQCKLLRENLRNKTMCIYYVNILQIQ